MVVLWLFSNYLSTAYETWVWPLIGFFILPTTTLAYAVAQNRYGGVEGGGLVLGVLGPLVGLRPIGGAWAWCWWSAGCGSGRGGSAAGAGGSAGAGRAIGDRAVLIADGGRLAEG